MAVCARSGEGVDALFKKTDETLPLDPVSPCGVWFPLAEGGPLHLLHEHGLVTATRYKKNFCDGGGAGVRIAAPKA